MAMKESKPYSIKLDLLPDISKEELSNFLKHNSKQELLESYLHPNLAKYIDKISSDKNVVDYIKSLPFTYDGSYGFDVAHVSAGGIKFSDVTDTLESKKEPGVHFIGELLDYDGPCGGYNLMWAFASALHASKSIK